MPFSTFINDSFITFNVLWRVAGPGFYCSAGHVNMLSTEEVCLPSKRKLFSGLLQHTVNNEVFRLATSSRLSMRICWLGKKQLSVVFIACVAGGFWWVFFFVRSVCSRDTRARGQTRKRAISMENLSFSSSVQLSRGCSLTLRTGFNTNPVRTTNEKRIKKSSSNAGCCPQ